MILSGFKKRLEDAKNNRTRIKVLFQYPASSRAVKKSGIVIEVADDSFTIDEKYDGECTYSYNYLVEVSLVQDFIYDEDGGKDGQQQRYGK